MKNDILYHTFLGLLRLAARLPLRCLYAISDLTYFAACHIIRYRRDVILGNLRHAFPEWDRQKREKTMKEFYRHLCDCIVETVKLLHMSDREIDRRIEVRGGDLVERTAADRHPIILYLGHYGNWEWAQAITRHYTRPAVSGQIYRPLHNAVAERLMQKIRSRFGSTSIPQKQAFRTLLRMRRDGQQSIIGFLADQRPNSGNLHHWTTFLNQDTAYAAGGEEIGRRTEARYLYLEVEKTGRGHYRMTFRPILPLQDGEPYPYTRGYMHMLEETIRHAPAYWLWSHKRWRFGRPVTLDGNNNPKEP